MWFISVLEKSHLGAIKSTIMTFLQTRNEAPLWLFSFFSNLHQYDFSPKQNGKFIGRNVIMVLTFFFFEPYRGSRGLPLVFLDCFMYFFHFRISGVATYKPSLGPFFGSKEKKTIEPPYLKITFGTNMTFLQNTADLCMFKQVLQQIIFNVQISPQLQRKWNLILGNLKFFVLQSPHTLTLV